MIYFKFVGIKDISIYVIYFKFVGIKDMHNIYYLGLSGERSLPFGLLVLFSMQFACLHACKCVLL